MSLKFKLRQEQRKNSKNKGKWYGRAVSQGTVGIDELTKKIQERCTVTGPDIMAVLYALVGEMTTYIKAGYRVKLDKLGAFRAGIKTRAADSKDKFTVKNNVISAHVIFQPEVKVDSMTGKRTTALINGIQVEQLGKYNPQPIDGTPQVITPSSGDEVTPGSTDDHSGSTEHSAGDGGLD